jgi:pimeloyl-ACP methyl ester carboxylesterase
MRKARSTAVPALLAGWFLAAQGAPPPPYPPPGRMVDAGGYRVHLYCTGEGSPTVIVAGAGYSFDWALVQPEVSRFTRICTYDVSGTAWSEPGPALTCSGRVDELHTILNKAGIRGPYILAGFSIGGLIERRYADLYPNEVVGMVIVDHAFIDAGSGDPPAESVSGPDSPPVLISKTPIIPTVEQTSDFGNLPERSRALHRWADTLNPALPTVETARECLALIGDARLGDMPLAVVSTANDHPNYRKLQAQLLTLSSRSIQLFAEKSFHSVEIEQPDIVVAAIRQVFERLSRRD